MTKGDTASTNGHTYQFQVYAANITGDSAVVTSANVQPLPPVISSDTPSFLVGYNPTGSCTIHLSWDSNNLPASSSVIYIVQARILINDDYIQNGWDSTTITEPVTSTSFDWTYQVCSDVGQIWTFQVYAEDLKYDGSGNPSAYTKSRTTAFDQTLYEMEMGSAQVNGVWVPPLKPSTAMNNTSNGVDAEASLWYNSSANKCVDYVWQVVCSGPDVPTNNSFAHEQPVTIGDYLFYDPAAWGGESFDDRLMDDAIERASLGQLAGARYETLYGPNIMYHEAVHKLQWAYLGPVDFPFDYFRDLGESFLLCHNKTSNPYAIENVLEQQDPYDTGLYTGRYLTPAAALPC